MTPEERRELRELAAEAVADVVAEIRVAGLHYRSSLARKVRTALAMLSRKAP